MTSFGDIAMAITGDFEQCSERAPPRRRRGGFCLRTGTSARWCRCSGKPPPQGALAANLPAARLDLSCCAGWLTVQPTAKSGSSALRGLARLEAVPASDFFFLFRYLKQPPRRSSGSVRWGMGEASQLLAEMQALMPRHQIEVLRNHPRA